MTEQHLPLAPTTVRSLGRIWIVAPSRLGGQVQEVGHREQAEQDANDRRHVTTGLVMDDSGIDQPNQPTQCQSLIDSANGWRTVSIIGFTGAGVMVATAIVVVLTAPHASTPHVACAPSLGGVACAGVF